MKNLDFSRLARANISRLKAYEAKEIPCRIKLDANENPYAPNIAIPTAQFKKLNRYPDPDGSELKKAAAKAFGVGHGNILLGNGSDELIYCLITAFGGPVLFPVPTFSMYGIISQALGEKAIAVPLDENFDLDIDKMLSAISRYKPKLIFLSSPNNPTGNCFSTDRILKIIEASKGIVIVDEAYQPFASDKGFIPLLGDYKNMAIMRTLSKVGLAALRVGFLIGDAEMLNEVNKARLPFNVNALSQATATAALKNKKQLSEIIKTVSSERDRLFKNMSAIDGIEAFPSEANFVLFRVDKPDYIYHALLEKGILIRNMRSAVKGCLRVTIGTPSENRAFINALKQIARRR
jgi:histidinol-phosphate aminotransferase